MHVFPIDRTKFINCEAKQHFQHRLVFACIYPCIQSLKCDNVPILQPMVLPPACFPPSSLSLLFFVHKYAKKGQPNNSQKMALNASNITKYQKYVIIIKNLKYSFLLPNIINM